MICIDRRDGEDMSSDVVKSEVIYGDAGDLALVATLYLPRRREQPMPLIIDIHGGAWSSGGRGAGEHYDQSLCAAGMAVLAIDFRQGPEHQHPSGSADVACAVRFARQHATQWGITPSSIGLVGSSSGGHLALLAALSPNTSDHQSSTPRGTLVDADARVDWVIALWPVSNPLARYHYVIARLPEAAQTRPVFKPDRLLQGHQAYFSSEQDMEDAAIQHILMSGEFQQLPSLFIVQPELDQNVPIFMSQTLFGAWQQAGGDACYKLYPGVAHGFAHREGEQTELCIADMIRFISER